MIQRIAARLTRLASVDEVATTICAEMREVIGHDEAHVLVIDDSGSLQPVAATTVAPGSAVVGAPLLDGPLAGTVRWAAMTGAPAVLSAIDGLDPIEAGSGSH